MVEQTVASAESNMRALAGDLPADEAAIQRAKRSEFYSLGLVLGYSYAGSPVIQPSARPDPAADTTSYTPAARARGRGCRTPGCPTARPSTTTSAAGSRCSGRCTPPGGCRGPG